MVDVCDSRRVHWQSDGAEDAQIFECVASKSISALLLEVSTDRSRATLQIGLHCAASCVCITFQKQDGLIIIKS